MNLKSVTPSISARESTKVDPKSRVKSENTSPDRDSQGRQEGQEQARKDFLTDEEEHEVLEKLRKISGIKDNGLFVAVERVGSTSVFKITDPTGKVLRRMTSNEAWTMAKTIETSGTSTKGRLLDKAG